jgi:DNA-directed RNA polymerase specialized sigma24 family protein
MRNADDDVPSVPGQGRFPATSWGVVLAAGGCDAIHRREALERLCATYWYPLYAYIRRRGHDAEEAQDLTQEFFARMLEKDWLSGVDAETGPFRCFLLTAVKCFLANEHDRAQTQKRGGGRTIVPFEAALVEDWYRREPGDEETPESIYDRRCALALLDRALKRLQVEAQAADKSWQFERLSPYLSSEAQPGEYGRIGAELGMGAGAVGVAVHRLRHRFREAVREEVAATARSLQQVEEELRHLLAALRGRFF